MSDLHRHSTTLAPFISLVPILIAGASMKARGRIVTQLRDARATSADRAISLDTRSSMERRWLERLVSAGVVRQAGSLSYLDEEAEQRACAKRKALRPLLIVTAVALAGLGIALALILAHRP